MDNAKIEPINENNQEETVHDANGRLCCAFGIGCLAIETGIASGIAYTVAGTTAAQICAFAGLAFVPLVVIAMSVCYVSGLATRAEERQGLV